MINRLLPLLLSFIIIMSCGFSAVASSIEVTAQSSVLMCADSGQILYEKNAQQRMSMASTTKIMTAILALESDIFDSVVTVGSEITGVEGSSLGLHIGDQLSFYDLVTGLMLASGNDAANVIAVVVAGSVEMFVALMNEKAMQLGMKNTHFDTPSGLDGETHFSTAYDMALLASYAMDNEIFVEICSQSNACIAINGKTVWLKNHNRLLNLYNGSIGIKTGFTKKSGRCLVSAAERNNVILIAVTLNAPNDWDDHTKLLNYGFSVAERYCASEPGMTMQVPVVGGSSNSVTCRTTEGLYYTADKQSTSFSTQTIVSPFLYAPVKKGTVVGCIYLIQEDKIVAKTAIVTTEDVKTNNTIVENISFSERFFQLLNGWISKWMI